MPILYIILLSFLGLIVGAVGGYFARMAIAKYRLNSAQEKVNEILEKAEAEAKAKETKLLLEAQEHILAERKQLEQDFKERNQDLQQLQRRLVQKEDQLDRRFDSLDKKEKDISEKESQLEKEREEVKKAQDHHLRELEKIARLTAEEAKRQLIAELTDEAKQDAQHYIRKIEDEIREQADEMAQDIIVSSVERNAAEVIAEKTISAVNLPNDDMKGRIIGREGRNIRAFEAIAGVDLIIDDTPETVIVSSFDPYRREVAKMALERLITDGRIHPARIEEVILKMQSEINQEIINAGKQACIKLKLSLPRELYPYIGRLKYRTSYGQNVYYHSIEVANIAGMIAGALKTNIDFAKQAGLLHDIGKTMKTVGDGGHALLSAEIAAKFNLDDRVVNAIASHHQEVEQKYIEAHIMLAADAISAARPGARRESFDDYIERLQNLEKIATDYEGVEKAYAIQAGREIRVFVSSDSVSDEGSLILARDIAKKIENTMKYPGQIKITLIRENRVVEYAR